MTEANESQNVVQQEQQPVTQEVTVKDNEATKQDGSSGSDKQEIKVDSEQEKAGKPDPEIAKQRFKESESKRLKKIEELNRELQKERELRAQQEARFKKFQEVAADPTRDGEVYDEFLDEFIPSDLPATEYKQRVATKYESDQKQQQIENERRERAELDEGITENFVKASAKKEGFESIIRNAVENGLIDYDIMKAIADKRVGRNEDDLIFLAEVAEKNPEELQKIVSKKTPEAKAVAIGELRAKFLNKPQSRVNTLPPPIEPLNDKGARVSTTVSTENTEEGFRARKRNYLLKSANKK